MDEYLDLIETSHFQACLSNIAQAKRDCLKAVKILNAVSKKDDAGIFRSLSQFTLEYYESLSQKSVFSFTDKLKWINSKLGDQMYPPVIRFSREDSDTTSLNGLFIEAGSFQDLDASITQFPDSMTVSYDQTEISDWSTNLSDLTTLYQDVLANCSFVSSFLSITDTLQDVSLLFQLIVVGQNNSKFKVCLNFNGCPRLVTIDNRLPILSNNMHRNLFVKSLNNDKLMWPALIEKAYLKIMGHGYRFIGSNMSIDTYILTGWIPETITLKNFDLPANFNELWKLNQEGVVLLGIGTGVLSQQLSSKLNLVTEHDYSINLYDDKSKQITIKNPWIENNNDLNRYISTNNMNHFKFLYVNWKVDYLFRYISKLNFIYTIVPQMNDKPQFSLQNHTNESQEVWIMLEKHLPIKQGDSTISLCIYETEQGERVFSHTQYKCLNANDTSTNNRFKLIKCVLKPKTSHTLVISSGQPCTFTLTLYNNISDEMVLTKAKNLYPWILQLEDAWEPTKSNAGGSWAMSTFINNPQLCLEVREELDLVLVLFSEANNTLLNFHMFHCDRNGKDLPLRNFDKSKLIFNEKYNEGFQIINKHLQPGHYKLIVSTFESNVFGKLNLLFNYSNNREALDVSKISNSLGLFMDRKQFQWNNANRFKLNFVVEKHNSNFSFQICHLNHQDLEYDTSSDYRPAIRASVFCASSTKPVQINEIWNDSLYGVFVDCLISNPGEYILLVERFEIGQGRCSVNIGCNKKFLIL